jgi:hypothetical protein
VLTDPDLLGSRRWRELSAADMRQMTVSEFAAWLGGMTNKEDRPFQEHTIRNYADAARTLDRWMTASEIDADFTACDTTVLNPVLRRLPEDAHSGRNEHCSATLPTSSRS